MENNKTQEQLIEQFRQNFIEEVRKERNKLLSETDYIHFPDVNVSDELKEKINLYRQELRDIPATVDKWLKNKDLFSVSVWGIPWPIKPKQ